MRKEISPSSFSISTQLNLIPPSGGQLSNFFPACFSLFFFIVCKIGRYFLKREKGYFPRNRRGKNLCRVALHRRTKNKYSREEERSRQQSLFSSSFIKRRKGRKKYTTPFFYLYLLGHPRGGGREAKNLFFLPISCLTDPQLLLLFHPRTDHFRTSKKERSQWGSCIPPPTSP